MFIERSDHTLQITFFSLLLKLKIRLKQPDEIWNLRGDYLLRIESFYPNLISKLGHVRKIPSNQEMP